MAARTAWSLMLGIVLLAPACGGSGALRTIEIGDDRTVVVGSRVTLEATASGFDTPTPSYAWSLAKLPAGSIATLSTDTGSTTELLVDVAGDFEVKARAADERGDAVASVTVSAVMPAEDRVTIDPIADQLAAQASTLHVPLLITGEDLEGVELLARSSFQRMVRDAAMHVEGTGSSRHLTIRTSWLAEMASLITMSIDVIAVRNGTELDVRTFTLDVTPPFASTPTHLGPPSVTASSRFGAAIAIHGDRMVVGAPTTPDSPDPGSAHVFVLREQGWLHEATLVPDEGASRQSFGRAVAIHGDVVVVGAPSAPGVAGNRGEAFIFTLVGEEWVRRQRLTAGPFGTVWDTFGISVAVDEHAIAVGAPVVVDAIGRVDFNGRHEGLAYMYRHEGDRWVVNGRLDAPHWPGYNWFGLALAMHEGHLIVAAPGAAVFDAERDLSGPVGGVMYFRDLEGGWTPVGHIVGSDGARNLGRSLALDSGNSVIGFSQPPPPERGFDFATGAVAVFSHAAEELQGMSLLAGEEGARFFGQSTAIGGGLLVVGEGRRSRCRPDRPCPQSKVEAFLLHEDGARWEHAASLHATLVNRPTDPADEFGVAIAIGTRHVAVTAPGQSLVYVFPR